MSSHTPKLLDVARLAGVGKTTASDAMSGTGRVSAETRALVLAAAQQLNYVPNGSARHLRKASTGTIAVVLPEALSRSNYYMSFVFGVVAEAAKRDFDVTIVSPSEQRGRERPIRADGVIISDPQRDDPMLPGLLDSSLAVVTCERIPMPLNAPEGVSITPPDGVVWSAHEAGMRLLLDEVWSAGSRYPALLVAEESVDWAASVTRAYRAWCAEKGLEPMVRTVGWEATWGDMREAAAELLAASPAIDALICGPDGSAAELLPMLAQFGRSVGENFVIASCVDSAPMQMASPQITSLDLRPRESGIACAQLLIDILTGVLPQGTELEHSIALTVRESTAQLPPDRSPRP